MAPELGMSLGLESVAAWIDELPPALALAWVGGLGLVVGSFLNVVIHRLPRDERVSQGRSHCPDCGALIRWYDNVPLVSWLWLRGRCRSCRAAISVRYPAVELACALLFVATAWSRTPVSGVELGLWLRDLPFVAMLLAAAVIDLEHRIIPDEISLGGLLWGLAVSWLSDAGSIGVWMSAVGAAVGFGVFYGFAWLYHRAKGQTGLGGGDIKLLAMIGAFLGPAAVFAVILLSSIAGSVLGVGWALWMRRQAERAPGLLQTALPFGPFLVLAAYYVFLIGDRVWLPFTIPT